MAPGQPEQKRPRLSTTTSVSTWDKLPAPTMQHTTGAHPPPPLSYTPHTPHPFTRPQELPPNLAHHHHEDRRHHEQDPYTPLPEQHRRLPPSPAHPSPYAQYSPSDPPVKRDPAAEDNSLPQLRRTNSTGNPPLDSLPLPPPAPHGPPPPSHHTEDQRRPPMSFDNRQPMPHSPAVYQPQHPAFPPPPGTPIAQHHPQYDAPTPHGFVPPPQPPPGPDIFASVPIANAKRKSQRAAQACDSCRVLKSKCDESKPCKNCRDKNIPCVWREQTTKQPDKMSSELTELMNVIKDVMTKGFKNVEDRLSRLEAAQGVVSSQQVEMKVESIEQDPVEAGQNHDDYSNGERPLSREPTVKVAPDEDHDSMEECVDLPPILDQAPPDVTGDDPEDNPGAPIIPGKPSIPINHTTLASYILEWDAVNKLIKNHLVKQHIKHVQYFPIQQEEERGILRVFGRGEALHKKRLGQQKDSQNSMDQAITDIMDDASDITSPSPSPAPFGDTCGQVGPVLPSQHKGGVLSVQISDGAPDFNRIDVWRYVDSFKKNILNMHPILIPKELDNMVNQFLDSMPKDATGKQPKYAKFTGRDKEPVAEPGMKRKRSPATDEQSPVAPSQRPGLPFRSIQSALVLLVLALGKICLHKGAIPDVVRDQDQANQPNTESPVTRNGVLASPLQGSPPGTLTEPQTSGLPSPKENERKLPSRRSSLQGVATVPKNTKMMRRNMDVIPGLDYFALATDIIGSHLGGHNLKHVYVFLLAGLYHGQLGRVMESWIYINRASVSMQIILRPRQHRFKLMSDRFERIEELKDNQLAFAFWTCLQLESDILAELPLPHSGLLAYEDHMPYPNIDPKMTEGYSEAVTSSYLAQLHLRKYLNRIHEQLYDPDPRNAMSGKTVEERMREIQLGLTSNKSWVPPLFKFSESDPPATDILSARLRAKYWGSQVIIYRPFLRVTLNEVNQGPDEIPLLRNDLLPREQWHQYDFEPEDMAALGVDPRAMKYSRLAIFALRQSTKAFHGMNPNERIIVTNHFTTAHAQWGNLLILAACHKHPILGKFVPRVELLELFEKTIGFFKMIAHQTSPLLKDQRILEALYKSLTTNDSEARPNSGFSSGTSAATPLQNAHSPGFMPPPYDRNRRP